MTVPWWQILKCFARCFEYLQCKIIFFINRFKFIFLRVNWSQYKLGTSENFATYRFQLLFAADRYVYIYKEVTSYRLHVQGVHRLSSFGGNIVQITCISSHKLSSFAGRYSRPSEKYVDVQRISNIFLTYLCYLFVDVKYIHCTLWNNS